MLNYRVWPWQHPHFPRPGNSAIKHRGEVVLVGDDSRHGQLRQLVGKGQARCSHSSREGQIGVAVTGLEEVKRVGR